MELIALIWIMIAHCIYMYRVVKHTNSGSDESTTDIYVACLLWPMFVIDVAIIAVAYGIDGLKWLWEYLGDIYWDIDCFIAYMQTVTRKPW